MSRGRFVVLCSLLTLALPLALRPSSRGSAQEPGGADRKLLQDAGLPTDVPGLVTFFRSRSLKEADRRQFEDLVKKLDDRAFHVPEKAARDLVARGPLALPFLKKALMSGSLELSLRVQQCIQKIERGPGPEQPAAAARLLALLPPRDPRETPAALEALMDYLPYVDDEWLEGEVLGAVGTLAARQGKMDLMVAALKDSRPERRAAAGYVLAQRGSLEQRKLVRQLLGDPDPTVRARAARGLLGKRLLQSAQVDATADEAQLRQAGVGNDGPGLLAFFAKRSLDEKAQVHLKQLIGQLGARAWSARQKASKLLVEQGPAAVPFLKAAAETEVPEVATRAADCIRKIKQGPGPALSIAAVRTLTRAAGSGKAAPVARAVEALLTYVPFADDEAVEEEVVNALCALSVRQPQVEPLFLSALHDPLPPRRAAAAYVLGRAGTAADCRAVQKLLADPVLKVRLRAAQGLVAARDPEAVPVLIDLLGKASDAAVWQVEELLQRIAANKGPDVPPGDNLAAYRRKAVTAWAAWWAANASRADLARASLEEQRLGLTTIVEYDSTVGNRQGRVWECGRDGNPRWTIANLLGPMDAQVLSNGRVLVAESSGGRVTERELATGNIVWQHPVPNPVACQRLPNGNTFIASYNGFVEVSPARQVVFQHNLTPNFFIFSARKQRSGHIVCMTSQGLILEIDPIKRAEVRRISVGTQGNWCGVELLPSGRYLVALMYPGELREIDAAGKVHWKVNFPGVFRATRLPNGNTLAVSMTTRIVAEVDRNGRRVWEKTCPGRPWEARPR